MEREQRRLAAIVVADVAGYSRLMQRDEAGTLATLNAHRREIVQPLVSARGGRIVKSTGDGFLMEFASVVDAVRCAVSIQQGMAARNADVGGDERIQFRMGINVGDIIVEDDDIFGDGVNVAARLEQLAEPGGVCLSDRAYRDASGRVDATFSDGGDQRLKNLADPVRVWHWGARPGTAPTAPRPAVASDGDRPSIAVLPFLNMGGDPAQEYFADGITEDVITALSRVRSLFVIARNSTFTYKGRSVDVRKVGLELGVRYVLEGSVRRAGPRVRTTAQLVDCATGNHIWADRYDGTLQDIFDLQDELTARIVGSLLPEMTEAEVVRAQRRKVADLSTWDLYLRALPKIRSNLRVEVDDAERMLRAVIAADGSFAAAYARLSSCRLKAAYLGWHDEASATEEATNHARSAIAADPTDGLGYDALASAQQRAGRMVEAITSARRALELTPSLTAAYGTLISSLAFCGEHEEAERVYERSERLNPRDPDRSSRIMGRLVASFTARRFADAVELAREHSLMRPNWYGSLNFLAASLAHLGDLEGARSVVDRVLQIIPGYNLSWARRRRMLQRDADHDSFIEGLRLAGVPEA